MIVDMDPLVFGLDIGGANLKLASADGTARSTAFALWKRPADLPAALRALADGRRPERFAVAMTGELCDCFATKREGVAAIVSAVSQAFPDAPAEYWTTAGRFVAPPEATRNPLAVAAANWHASATALAREFPDERLLVLDCGSTTFDITPIEHGKVAARGLTDSARLESGELVYTGVRRTPLCHLFGAKFAAEFFSTTLDVGLMLGQVAEDARDRDTADGRPATIANAHARIARMAGADAESLSRGEALALALQAQSIQVDRVCEASRDVLARQHGSPDRVVVAGSGSWLARIAWDCFADSLGLSDVPISDLADLWGGPDASTAACAVALAKLAQLPPSRS